MAKRLGKRQATRKNTVTAFACYCWNPGCTCSGTPTTAFLEDQNRKYTRNQAGNEIT